MKQSLVWAAALLLAAVVPSPARADGWVPRRSVEFIVPADTGGGADQMARLIQNIIAKHNLMPKPMVVLNKGGGAGAEGFMDLRGAKGDPHKIIITLSNLFTTPLATGLSFGWKDMTPVTMMALDQFVLWVNADAPYTTAAEYIDAVKAAGPRKMKMGGTGSKQEDQIITAAIEQQTGTKFIFIPFKGGGAVAVQLVGKHLDSSVNNPVEAVSHWRGGKLKPLCVFADKPMPYPAKIAGDKSWADIAPCHTQGLDVRYEMLRGIFMAPGVPAEARDYYAGLMAKVRETPEWKAFLNKGALNPVALTGDEFRAWLARESDRHTELMDKAGFIRKK